MRSAYAACKVFVLPTWFETPGLAAMEAALAGANLVVTREGSTREYFKEFAEYVNPASVPDIRDKILRALGKTKRPDLARLVRERYVWEKAAQDHIRLYQTLGLQTTERVMN